MFNVIILEVLLEAVLASKKKLLFKKLFVSTKPIFYFI